MEDLNRRQAVLAATGIAALAGLTSPVKAEEKPNPMVDESAEKKRVMECGMTEAEAECWIVVSQAAGKFFDLPKLHSMDDHEVAHAIHVIQHKLLSRPVYRKYKELAMNPKK